MEERGIDVEKWCLSDRLFQTRPVSYDEGMALIQRKAREGGLTWDGPGFFEGSELSVEYSTKPCTKGGSGNLTVATPYAAELSAFIVEVNALMGGPDDYEDFVVLPKMARAFGRASQGGATVAECVAAALDPLRHHVHVANETYFAYGSNMDERQMARRCPDAQLYGRMMLRDYRLVADEAGFLSIEPWHGSVVEGLLWNVSLSDIDALDRYEGVASGCYRKEGVDVEGRDGHNMSAVVYISERPTARRSCNPEYMERVIDAAAFAHLRPTTLARLEELAGLR